MAQPRWITEGEAEGPPIINPTTGRPYQRFGPYIDLGMLSVRDAAIYGRTRPLIPYAEGRVISSVRFVPGGTGPIGCNAWAMTPNTVNLSGFASIPNSDLSEALDTIGIVANSQATDLSGDSSNNAQILDVGPLIVGTDNPIKEFVGLVAWQRNTPYCVNDSILDSNDNVQSIGINGVSGSTEPTWEISGTTDDGTAQWNFAAACPSGTIHLVVEVIEGVSPMPPYPATLEFIQQPTDAAAEATISPAITVKILDQYGAPFVFAAVTVSLFIYGAGTLVGTSSKTQNQITGIATFDDLSITEPGTGYILRAELYPTIVTEPIFSDPFDVTAP